MNHEKLIDDHTDYEHGKKHREEVKACRCPAENREECPFWHDGEGCSYDENTGVWDNR